MIDTNQTVTCLGNIPWLSDLPSHWKVVRSKRLFAVRKERAFPDDEQLSATQAYGVISQAEYERKIGRKVVRITQHLDKRAHVEKDDFVISMRSFQGGLERAWARGCIRSSYVVLQPAPEVHINYFAHLFKSHDYIRALQATSNFIRDGQDLNFRNFSLVDLPLPPIEEQIAIGRFLDHADRRIRRYIRAKRQLIALLNEQKQAIIHRAVTRGLDPHVKLKPSGVEWLGDVPEHWDTKKLRALVRVTGGMTPSKAEPSFWNGSVSWVSPKDMKVPVLSDSIDHITEVAVASTNIQLVPPPAVLIVVRGMILARTFPVAVTAVPVTINQDMKALLPGNAVTADYLRLLLLGTTAHIQSLVEESGHGTRVLRTEVWRDVILPVPPLPEQAEVVSVVRRQLDHVDEVEQQTLSEMTLLREYRTRLIADVVTGKLDVREAAAALTDELEVVDPDAEELLDDDDSTDDVELDTEPEEVEA